MSTIKDVKEVSAKLLKKDTFDVYKAYFFDKESDGDHKMVVNENIDMFGLSPEAAVQELLQTIPSEVFVAQMNAQFEEIRGTVDSDKLWLYESMVVSFDGKVKDNDVCTVEMKDVVVPILVLHMNMDDLKEKPIIKDSEEYVFHDDVIGMTLEDKRYEIECGTQRIVSFKAMIDSDGTRQLSDVKLEVVDEPRKKVED